jgi:hypothetical protein
VPTRAPQAAADDFSRLVRKSAARIENRFAFTQANARTRNSPQNVLWIAPFRFTKMSSNSHSEKPETTWCLQEAIENMTSKMRI